MMWEAAYVGSRSQHLLNDGIQNINVIPYGTLLGVPDASGVDANLYRPFLNYQNVNVIRKDFYQNYNAFQTGITRRSGRLILVANYTFSKALGVRGAAQGQVGNQIEVRQNYGPLSYDRTHIGNFAYSYELPNFAGDLMGTQNAFARGLLDGWQLSGVTQMWSGVNLQAAGSNANFSLSVDTPDGADPINPRTTAGTPDVSLMPRLICDPRQNLAENQYINGACFAAPTYGQNGDYVFPYLKGPAFFNSDLSLFKNFDISESKRLQFRFMAYNFLNHPLTSFTTGDPRLNLSFDTQGNIKNPRFGYADDKVGRRIIQLALKFYF
jgi:hypothetical protein